MPKRYSGVSDTTQKGETKMKQETKARIRVVGRILFLVYLLALVYFLFFAEEYGRRNFFELDYRYNLVPFQEIRRFWIYREKVGFLAANGEFLESIASWFYVQPLRGDDSAHHEGGLL